VGSSDSTYIDNKCSKYGVGDQFTIWTKKSYLYTDYARMSGVTQEDSCTIVYTNEQTSTDLGTGNDAGGYGIQGVDIGFVSELLTLAAVYYRSHTQCPGLARDSNLSGGGR